MKINLIIFLSVSFINVSLSQSRIEDFANTDTINNSNYLGKQGTWVFYDRMSGIVENIQIFRNDTLNGISIWYWPNSSQISDKCFYLNGKIEGVFYSFWEDGSTRGLVNYKNGYPDGISIAYKQNGDLQLKIKYNYGKIDSSYNEMFIDNSVQWDSNAPVQIDTVRNTSEQGDWNKEVFIYHDNILHQELLYYRGRLRMSNCYDENANLIKRIVYFKRSKKIIEKVFFFESGKRVCGIYYNRKGVILKKEGGKCP